MPTVYVTSPPAAADEIATTLVEERLAACVNRIPCRSTYRWEGDVHHDDEELLLAKTTDDAYPRLVTRLEELHPHDVPCIERFAEEDLLESFAAWRDANVRSPTG